MNKPQSKLTNWMRMRKESKHIKDLLSLLGKKGIFCIGIGMLSSLMLAGIEFLIAVFMIVFLFSLNLIDQAQLPIWLPYDIRMVPPVAIWFILVFIGLLQAVGYLLNSQTRHVLLELVRARLKTIQGYDYLWSIENKQSPLAKSIYE